MIVLREYQWPRVRQLCDHLVMGAREVALVMPTGSGKSTVILAMCARLANVKRKEFTAKGFFVVTPFRSILASFKIGNKDSLQIQAPEGIKAFYNLTVVNSEHKRALFKRALSPGNRLTGDSAILFPLTHQALGYWHSEVERAPDLTGQVLVIDEAHMLPASGDWKKLGAAKDLWLKKGGSVVYCTATPYTPEGEPVWGDVPTVEMPIGEYLYKIGKAENQPFEIDIKTRSVPIDLSDTSELFGEVLPADISVAFQLMDAYIQAWKDDGCPFAVFIIPSPRNNDDESDDTKKSVEWAAILHQKLEEEGKHITPNFKVLNGVGASTAKQREFEDTLAIERQKIRDGCRVEDLGVHVVLAVRRMDMGTDWAPGCAIYIVGIPSSYRLIVQRAGRICRAKTPLQGSGGITDYPTYPTGLGPFKSRVTLLLPRVSTHTAAKAKRDFKKVSSRVLMSLAFWLENHKMARLLLGSSFTGGHFRWLTAAAGTANPRSAEMLKQASQPDYIREQALQLLAAANPKTGVQAADLVARMRSLNEDPALITEVCNIIAAVLADKYGESVLEMAPEYIEFGDCWELSKTMDPVLLAQARVGLARLAETQLHFRLGDEEDLTRFQAWKDVDLVENVFLPFHKKYGKKVTENSDLSELGFDIREVVHHLKLRYKNLYDVSQILVWYQSDVVMAEIRKPFITQERAQELAATYREPRKAIREVGPGLANATWPTYMRKDGENDVGLYWSAQFGWRGPFWKAEAKLFPPRDSRDHQ